MYQHWVATAGRTTASWAGQSPSTALHGGRSTISFRDSGALMGVYCVGFEGDTVTLFTTTFSLCLLCQKEAPSETIEAAQTT